MEGNLEDVAAATYSREKTLALIQECFSTLVQENNLSEHNLTQCTITVHTANFSWFSWGHWLNYKDISTTMTYTFTPFTSKKKR
ncbi:MAG: hypothetical protein KDK71_03125 [Chlamydiia bacterium]|nr:hypothetical protein [Chlamydiia bacterium]